MIDLGPGTEQEREVLDWLRAIKKEQKGKGHGTLRVEITDGSESLLKREYSHRWPQRAR